MENINDIRKGLGLVHIYTGNGKGKTTAAFGLAMRAAGRGLNVLVMQFMKPSDGYGEQIACGNFPNIDIVCAGLDHFVSDPPSEEDVDAANAALKETERLLSTGRYDVAVLDESINAVRLGLFDSSRLIGSLERRPVNVEAVLTGRGMTPELEEYADLVTEMRLVKHPYDRGVDARKGVEY